MTGTVQDRANPHTDESRQLTPSTRQQRSWETVVWDDPVNLMSYVSYVFRSHFGMNRDRAEQLMLLVHTEGSAVVAEGDRSAMELHVEAMHAYGLWATLRERGE